MQMDSKVSVCYVSSARVFVFSFLPLCTCVYVYRDPYHMFQQLNGIRTYATNAFCCVSCTLCCSLQRVAFVDARNRCARTVVEIVDGVCEMNLFDDDWF